MGDQSCCVSRILLYCGTPDADMLLGFCTSMQAIEMFVSATFTFLANARVSYSQTCYKRMLGSIRRVRSRQGRRISMHADCITVVVRASLLPA